MTTNYWNQWDKSEVLHTQHIEITDYLNEHIVESNDMIEGEEQCCSGCMDCLGLSWRDFF